MHIAGAFAKFHGKRVLLIDFDPQANLSIGLGIGPDNLETMVPVLQGQQQIRTVIQKTYVDNLHIVASNAYLDGIERTPQLGNDPYAHERLRRSLREIEGEYDFCFIDTPPSLGWLTQSAFFASHYSIVCAIPEAYSVIALRRLSEFHETIRRYHEIDVFGVILSFWDERGAMNKEFLQEIDASFPKKLFQSKVRRDVSVSRAVLAGQTVFDYDKESRAAEDYRALANELINRFDDQKNRKSPEEFAVKIPSKSVMENVKATI